MRLSPQELRRLHERTMTMNEYYIKRAITPLRLIFWGLLICIIDLNLIETTTIAYPGTTVSEGFKFDILNDVIGTLLIACAVFRLASIPVHRRYRAVMKFLKIVSVLSVLDAIRDHYITVWPPLIELSLKLFDLITLVAVVAFCIAMRWFCQEAGLKVAARSWRFTTIIFVVFFLLPIGFVDLIIMLAIASGKPAILDFGLATLLMPLVDLIPLIHFFISTSRMKRGAAQVRFAQTGAGYGIGI